MICSECIVKFGCTACPSFEAAIEELDNIDALKDVRRNLMHPPKDAYPWTARFADWMVARVSTLKFFLFCIVLSLTPLIWKEQQGNVLYISNIFQLTLLPVILIAGARQAAMDSDRHEREYRMVLVGERIQELQGEKK